MDLMEGLQAPQVLDGLFTLSWTEREHRCGSRVSTGDTALQVSVLRARHGVPLPVPRCYVPLCPRVRCRIPLGAATTWQLTVNPASALCRDPSMEHEATPIVAREQPQAAAII